MRRLFHSILIVLLAVAPMLGAIITVTNTSDAGSGSLRWAITSANLIAGKDTIQFNIPAAGVQTIAVASQLPRLTDFSGVFMDGLSQPGAVSGAQPPATAVLMIVLEGRQAGQSHGIWILSANNTIRGLVIKNFQREGIRIEGTANGSDYNTLLCNFVGTDETGTKPQGNGSDKKELWAGIDILVTPSQEPKFARKNVVEANLVSDNYAEGIAIMNCPPGDVSENLVLQNYVGTDISGTMDLGNEHTGVFIGEGAHDNLVDNNLISGNNTEGIAIVGYPDAYINTFNNTLTNNRIGIDAFGSPLPNNREGVNIGEYFGTKYQGGFAPHNTIGPGNIIAYNGSAGIAIWEHYRTKGNADGNLITMNMIYANNGLGIDLGNDGVTLNDFSDLDTGANQQLNHPVITSALFKSGQALISGTILIDRAPQNARVELFIAKPDPSGYGEGAQFLAAVTPDAAGNWAVMLTGVTLQDSLTATTSDDVANTSEFCPCTGLTLYTQVETRIAAATRHLELAQNYPNPFNAETTIPFWLEKRERVRLELFNLLGQSIRVLLNDEREAGHHELIWDGRNAGGITVSSGVYFARLETPESSALRRLPVASK